MRPSSAIARTSAGSAELDLDHLARLVLRLARANRVAHHEQMETCGSVRRVGEERAHELGRRSGEPGLFGELARRARRRRFVPVEHAGRKLEDELLHAMLVLPDEQNVPVARQRKDHAEAARFTDEIVLDDVAAGQLDAVGAQLQELGLDAILG